MNKSPNKEMVSFFAQCIGLGGVLLLIIGTVIVKFLEVLGVVRITIG